MSVDRTEDSHNDPRRRARVKQLGLEIGRHLEEIAALYQDGVKLTLIARVPTSPHNNRDTVMTDDPDPEAVIAAFRKLYMDPGSERYAI